ncbi:unnamed protein product [Durusdinium trenchii]
MTPHNANGSELSLGARQSAGENRGAFASRLAVAAKIFYGIFLLCGVVLSLVGLIFLASFASGFSDLLVILLGFLLILVGLGFNMPVSVRVVKQDAQYILELRRRFRASIKQPLTALQGFQELLGWMGPLQAKGFVTGPPSWLLIFAQDLWVVSVAEHEEFLLALKQACDESEHPLKDQLAQCVSATLRA